LIGGLVGAGMAARPGEIQFDKLWNTFLLPLLLSPVIAAFLGMIAYRLLRLRSEKKDCACVLAPGEGLAADAASISIAAPHLVIAEGATCDRLHIFSGGLICFARGVNDTPKPAALLIAAQLVNAEGSVLLIAAVMAAGGLLFARRVAETMVGLIVYEQDLHLPIQIFLPPVQFSGIAGMGS
jgi:PiT family inorganic phosphate transporter